MLRGRILGFAAAMATAGMVVAAPVLAASQVQVPLSSLYNEQVFLKAGQTLPQTKSYSACRVSMGATGGPNHALNATGVPSGNFTPTGSPVSFNFPPITSNDSVCIRDPNALTAKTEPSSVTIPVPAGNYTDAYFLAFATNGPTLVSVTPVYSSGDGTAQSILFDDWCALMVGAKTLTSDSTAGFVGGPRVASKNAATDINCGLFNTHLSGLDSSKTLTALKLAVAPDGTAIPAGTGVSANATQSKNTVVHVIALTMEGTQSAAAASSSGSSGSSGSSSSLPQTGGNQTGILVGLVLLLGGAALAVRPRLARSTR